MHAAVLPVALRVLVVLTGQFVPIEDPETQRAGPGIEVHNEVPASAPHGPTFDSRHARTAPAATLEAPEQIIERSVLVRDRGTRSDASKFEKAKFDKAKFEKTAEPEIAPVAFNEPTESTDVPRQHSLTHAAPGNSSAQVVLRQALSPMPGQTLQGRPLTMLESVRGYQERSGQLRAIQEYWKTTTAIAEQHWASKEAALLGAVKAPASPHDLALLHAARESANATATDAEMHALSARLALADLSRLGVRGEPPIPADEPLVGEYHTNFEAIFAQRAAPTRVVQMVRMLPVQQRLVVARAASVQASESLVEQSLNAYQSGQATISQLLEAVTALKLERRGFLAAVRDYNYSIAEYSLAAVGSAVSQERLVSTLVKAPAVARANPGAAKGDSRAKRTTPPITRSSHDERDRNVRSPISRAAEPAGMGHGPSIESFSPARSAGDSTNHANHPSAHSVGSASSAPTLRRGVMLQDSNSHGASHVGGLSQSPDSNDGATRNVRLRSTMTDHNEEAAMQHGDEPQEVADSLREQVLQRGADAVPKFRGAVRGNAQPQWTSEMRGQSERGIAPRRTSSIEASGEVPVNEHGEENVEAAGDEMANDEITSSVRGRRVVDDESAKAAEISEEESVLEDRSIEEGMSSEVHSEEVGVEERTSSPRSAPSRFGPAARRALQDPQSGLRPLRDMKSRLVPAAHGDEIVEGSADRAGDEELTLAESGEGKLRPVASLPKLRPGPSEPMATDRDVRASSPATSNKSSNPRMRLVPNLSDER